MTAIPKRGDPPVPLPDSLAGFAELVAAIDWLVVTEAIMLEAGADQNATHLFFVDFTIGAAPVRVSELAPFLSQPHGDWRPAATRAAHHVLVRNGVIVEAHDRADCAYCAAYLRTAYLQRI